MLDGKEDDAILKILDVFHIYAFLYNPNLPNITVAIKCFYYSISQLLSSPYKEICLNYLKELPLDSRNSLFHWTYQLRKAIVGNMIDYNAFYKYYNSLEIDKTYWGNRTWYCIHYLAKVNSCTKESIKAYKAFISCLQFVLPCEMCRNHLSQNLGKIHIDKYCNKKLFLWSILLHNVVNKSINKKEYTVEEVYNLY